MNEGRVSVRYAKALLSAVGDDTQKGRAYYDAAGLLVEVLTRLGGEFQKMLHSTVVEEADELRFVERMVERVAPVLLPFTQLMYKHQRAVYLERALRMFRLLYSQKFGIVHAHVEACTELPKRMHERLEAFLQQRFGKQIEVDYSEDRNLIGGFTVEVNDSLLDCSIAGELRSMLSEL